MRLKESKTCFLELSLKYFIITNFFNFLFTLDMLLLTAVEFSKSYLNGTLIRMILVWLSVFIK